MKAAVIENFGKDAPVKIIDLPTPEPLDNEVQIAIKNSSVNPVDWKIRDGQKKSWLPYDFPIILGWDAAGVISKAGKKVTTFKVGDEVIAFCRKPLIKWGTFAEFVCVDSSHVAYKPKNLSFMASASIPLTGLTAWQSLFDKGELKKGEKVLIHAGAGGVGGMAIQFAKVKGAFVITTASSKNHPYVKRLGADLAIDYTNEDFVEKIKELYPEGIDLVFDTFGGDVCQKSFEVIKEGGRVVSILESNLTPPRHIRPFYVSVEPNGAELKEIAELLEKGKVKPLEIEVLPLKDVEKALNKSAAGHVRGKLVIAIG